MTDQVDSTGVPMDQDEYADPSENTNAPDALLGESAQVGGALSKVGSQEDKQSRVSQGRSAMGDLRSQFTRDQGMAADAYASQKKVLEDATARLLSTQAGPSPQEAAYRIAAAVGTGDSRGSFNPAGISAAHADILKEQREQELAKQQLIQQYGMQVPQAQLGAANANINRDVQLMRIQASQNNSAETQADKAPKVTNKYYTPDPNDPTKQVFNQALYDTDMQATQQKANINAKAKLASQQFAATGLVSPEMIDIAKNNMKDLPTAVVRNPAAMAQILKAVHDDAQANGNAPQAFWAGQQLNRESGKVLDDYEKGKTHQQLDGINTAVQHINVLKPVIAALGNGDNSWVNNIKNTWDQKVMGSPAPTDFNGVRDFVTGEIAKAVLPGGGGEAERQGLQASAAQANSAQALNSIVQKWQELLAGKTRYAKFNWDNSTGGKYGVFEDKFLMPDTRAALGMAQKAAPQQPQQPAVNPLVSYYSALGKWKAAGSQGPAPVKPAGI